MLSKIKLVISFVTFVITSVIVIVPSVVLTPRTYQFRTTFKERCEGFREKSQNCENILATFEQAYVRKDHCNFAEKNYDPVFAVAPFRHPSGKSMFWSDTKDLVRKFTETRECFYILEDTLLGSVLNTMSWCGEEGNGETYIMECENCKPNPVSAFWSAASREDPSVCDYAYSQSSQNTMREQFAQYASGTVTVMLNGRNKEPYSPDSVLGRVEIPNLQAGRVKQVNVYLITDQNNGQCNKDSLKILHSILNQKGISHVCNEVTQSQLEKCIAENTACGACWAGLLDSKYNDTVTQDTT